MNQTEIIKELREILKLYHYESTTEQMSKDVVTSLENLLGSLMNSNRYEFVRCRLRNVTSRNDALLDRGST